MKNLIIIAALLVSAQFSNAAERPALIQEVPQYIQHNLEDLIKASVEKQNGLSKIDGFVVDWENVENCIEVFNEMDPSKLMGTCLVNFGAFQIQGQAIIIVRANGYGFSILYTNIE